MPPRTHVAVLRGRDMTTGEPLQEVVVWADRAYAYCPRCGESVPQNVGCPATLNAGAGQGGQLGDWDQQHGCGTWLAVDWVRAVPSAYVGEDDELVTPGVTERDVVRAARELADEREVEIEKLRADAAAILRADLQAALDELAEPLGDDESDQERIERLATGTEVNPGVCVEDGQWSAWAYDPAGGDDPVIVYA
jgi:hypothetical protein